jgi:hypothetical protein
MRTVAILAVLSALALGDGKIIAPRDYKGSIEERSQEAIIVFHGSKTPGGTREDLILKVTVEGSAGHFAWVIPFPSAPEVSKADAALFRELFDYVEVHRSRRTKTGKGGGLEAKAAEVEVLSRKIVGSYDVAVVRERVAGTLNGWLDRNGYRALMVAEEVVGDYSRRAYVFSCIKVSAAALRANKPVDLHPLRFTFDTGGRDGIYYPMRMTGLQRDPFDVNLYVFYRHWINDRVNRFGFVHKGFRLRHRDWDGPKCRPNGGKDWCNPEEDPFLRPLAGKVPTVARFLRALRPGARYYLTNIQAFGLKPQEVRRWRNDLWLFPYYTDEEFVPYDARPGGPAAATSRSSRE